MFPDHQNASPDKFRTVLNGPVAPPVTEESIWVSTLFPNTAYVQLWRILVRIFLVIGVIATLQQLWQVSADLLARATWPSADGEIVSANLRDDNAVPGKIAERRYTHYWVEYEVRFAAAGDQCKTGLLYNGPPSSMPCIGHTRTRSTRSSRQAWEWLNTSYPSSAHLKVLYAPDGPRIKIAGESIWLRYGWGQLVLFVLWDAGFFFLYAFLRRRMEYFRSHPEAETIPAGRTVPEDYKITTLDLS